MIHKMIYIKIKTYNHDRSLADEFALTARPNRCNSQLLEPIHVFVNSRFYDVTNSLRCRSYG